MTQPDGRPPQPGPDDATAHGQPATPPPAAAPPPPVPEGPAQPMPGDWPPTPSTRRVTPPTTSTGPVPPATAPTQPVVGPTQPSPPAQPAPPTQPSPPAPSAVDTPTWQFRPGPGRPAPPYPTDPPQSTPPYPASPYPAAAMPGRAHPAGYPASAAGHPAAPPGFPPAPGTAHPQRRRGLLVTSIVLAVVLVLCGGGGLATFLLLRNAENGEGAADPVAAVDRFMTAVYSHQDTGEAAGLVCSEARDEERIARKVAEVKGYAKTYKNPRFRWDEPTVDDQNDERALVSLTLTMTTGDEKTARQKLNFTVVKKTGWWICEVGGQPSG